jgi:hypothetical protein
MRAACFADRVRRAAARDARPGALGTPARGITRVDCSHEVATKRRRGRCSKPAPSIGWCQPAALGGVAVASRIAELASGVGPDTSFLDRRSGAWRAAVAAALPGNSRGGPHGSLLADETEHARRRVTRGPQTGLGVIPDPVALARCRSGASPDLAA